MTPPTLPPGQVETKRFPIVGERSPSGELSTPDEWSLTVEGLVENTIVLGLDDFMRLDQREITFGIHCVTSWTRFDSTFTGVPLTELLDQARPQPEARFVSYAAFSDRGHHTSLPLETAIDSSWLAHSFDGEPLAVEHGGPVRVVTPGRYFYKSLKWVKSIELLAHDRLGWWETNSSYHNGADPWAGDQRFTTGSLRPEQLRRFLDAASYDKYRGKVMLGLDLTEWRPSSSDLRRLYLKACDMRGIDLASVDLRAANLSLSDLSGANLADADLSGSDLEGANFAGANLSGANLSGSALSAARFEGAVVEGAGFDGSWGLLESQQVYLAANGIYVDS